MFWLLIKGYLATEGGFARYTETQSRARAGLGNEERAAGEAGRTPAAYQRQGAQKYLTSGLKHERIYHNTKLFCVHLV